MAAAVSKYAPVAGMLYVQVAYSAMYLITRFALTRGLSHYAFVFYRQFFAAAAICPVAFYINRDGILSSVRWKNLRQIFLLALIGITISQNFYYAGLALTSSTFASTMNNLQPAVTFVLAYILRLEQVSVRSRSGQAKIFGTLLCVGGATVMTFFGGGHDHSRGTGSRGPLLLDHPAPDPRILKLLGLDLVHSNGDGGGGGGGGGNFLFGAFLTMMGSWSWCVFLIYQAWIVEEYPSQLSLSSLVSVIGCLQVGAVALLLENPAALTLHWDLRLLVVTYGGVFCSGFGMFTIMWCVKEKGPVFATALNPLSTVLVAALEPLLQHEQLTWMSFFGIVVVIGGLYLFLWGKAGEESVENCYINESQRMNVDAEGGHKGNDMLTGEKKSIREPLLVKSI